MANALLDGLTPEEERYINSGGQTDLPGAGPDGQGSPPAAPEPAPARETPPATATAPAEPAAPEGPDEGDDDQGEAPEVDPKTGKLPPRKIAYRKFRAVEDQLTQSRKELADRDARLNQLNEAVSRADERLRIINEAISQPAQQEPEPEDLPPDPREDIFGYVEWQSRQIDRLGNALTARNQELEDRYQQFEEQRGYEQDVNAIDNRYRNDAVAFGRQNPTFAPAYVHLVQRRDEQYRVLGIEDPEERNRRIMQEEREVVANAYQRGLNPAQVIYNLAVATGFNAAAAPAPGNGNGGAPAAARPATNVAAEIAAVRNGQTATQSLSRGGGSPPPTALTHEQLANMPEDEFNAYVERIQRDPRQKHRLRDILPGA